MVYRSKTLALIDTNIRVYRFDPRFPEKQPIADTNHSKHLDLLRLFLVLALPQRTPRSQSFCAGLLVLVLVPTEDRGNETTTPQTF